GSKSQTALGGAGAASGALAGRCKTSASGCGLGFQLGDLGIVTRLQGAAYTAQNLGPRKSIAGFTHDFAEVVGERAVVAAVDECISRGLVVRASGPQDMVNRSARSAPQQLLAFELVFLAFESSKKIERRFDVSIQGGVGRSELGRASQIKHSQPGSGVARVQIDLEQHTSGQSSKKLVQIIIGDVRAAIPFHVPRADQLVQRIGQFVAVSIADLGAVSGVMEDKIITRLGTFNQPVEPIEDIRLGGTVVCKNPDFIVGESEQILQNAAHVRD